MTPNKTKIIGLTGGIATGKSTVSRMLKQKGLPVIDADIIARDVVKVGKPAYHEIVEAFGVDILNNDNTIDRKKLGKAIFSNVELRLLLNKIIHPRILEEIRRRINELSKNNNVIFLDIPLLIEEKESFISSGIMIDQIWLVYATKDIQINRQMNRDGIDYQMALNKINSQMPIDEKKKLSDVIIDNTKSLDHLTSLINELVCDL